MVNLRQNRNLFIIALIAVVNALGYGIIIPVVYSYAIRFGINPFQYGLLFATFSVCQFLSTPIIGRLSDRFGRRPLLITSLSGTTISFIMMAFAPNAAFLFLARALDGITAGNIPVASAVISDTTTEKERAKGFGIIGASFGFGFIFGPVISGLTVGINPALPFIIAAAITLLATLLTWWLLPETNKHIGQVSHDKLFNFSRLYHVLFEPNVGTTLIITLFYFTAFGMFIAIFQLFSKEILHMTDQQISFLFTLFGIVGLLTQLFIVGRVTKWIGIKRAFTYSILFSAIAFAGMFFSTTIALYVVASILLGMANSLVNPLTQTILSMETDEKNQGSVQGLNASYMSIGQIVGPILGGVISSIFIPLPFLVASFCVLLCFLLSFKVLRPDIKKEAIF